MPLQYGGNEVIGLYENKIVCLDVDGGRIIVCRIPFLD